MVIYDKIDEPFNKKPEERFEKRLESNRWFLIMACLYLGASVFFALVFKSINLFLYGFVLFLIMGLYSLCYQQQAELLKELYHLNKQVGGRK